MKKYITILLSVSMLSGTMTFNNVIKFYSNVKTMEGKFKQKFCEESTSTCILTEGNFYTTNSDKFRIEIKSPYKQYIVSDGENTIMYDVGSNIAIKVDAGQMQNAFGMVDLVKQIDEYYSVVEKREEKKLTVFKLIPKNENLKQQMDSIIVKVDSKGRMKYLNYYDAMGNESEIIFLSVKYNRKISASKFKLDLPESVQIIDQSQLQQR